MKGFLKKNRKYILIAILVPTVLGVLFYWFEYRPTKIRHDCSWTKEYKIAKPAEPGNGVTIEEYNRSKEDWQKCIDKSEDGKIVSLTKRYRSLYAGACGKLLKDYIPPKPAEPADDWYEPATKDEYSFCIKENGLSQ